MRGPRTTHFRSAKKKKKRNESSWTCFHNARRLHSGTNWPLSFVAAPTRRRKILLPRRHKTKTPTPNNNSDWREREKNITYQTSRLRPDGIIMHTRHHLSLLFDSTFFKISRNHREIFWFSSREEGRRVIIISRITFDVAGMRARRKKKDAFYNTHTVTQRLLCVCVFVVVSGLFFSSNKKGDADTNPQRGLLLTKEPHATTLWWLIEPWEMAGFLYSSWKQAATAEESLSSSSYHTTISFSKEVTGECLSYFRYVEEEEKNQNKRGPTFWRHYHHIIISSWRWSKDVSRDETITAYTNTTQ